MNVIEPLAFYLATLDLVRYNPTGIAAEGAPALFLEKKPQGPDACVSLYATGGLQTDGRHGYDSPVVNVQVRGATDDVLGAIATADGIYAALHGFHNGVWPTGAEPLRIINCLALQSAPISIGRDDNDRPGYSLNFQIEVRNLTVNRE